MVRISTRDEGITCYCDGACTGNPGPGGWGAIVRTPDGQVREYGGAENPTTNNRMELQGAIHSLYAVRGQTAVPVDLYTDSTYVIKGITEWVFGWKKRNWVKVDGQPVVNRDLWEDLLRLVQARPAPGTARFHHVPGHAGIPGNERCDRISVAFAQGQRPGLYRGPAAEYRVDLTPPPPGEPPPERSAGARRPAATSAVYLSLVDGELERHATWDECKARVHGVPNAQFKKCKTDQEVEATLAGWGVAG
jgi:ribonuclease HI